MNTYPVLSQRVHLNSSPIAAVGAAAVAAGGVHILRLGTASTDPGPTPPARAAHRAGNEIRGSTYTRTYTRGPKAGTTEVVRRHES